MKVLRILFLTYFILIFTNFNFANKLDKGFAALEKFDYFKAKNLFAKKLKKEPCIAAYGLSLIYKNDKNPFYSLDSAYKYISFAIDNFDSEKKKNLKKYEKYKISYNGLRNLRNNICDSKMDFIEKNPSPQDYQFYLNFYKTCGDKDEIIGKRNSLAFEIAKSINTPEAFNSFIETYPDAKEVGFAKELREENKYAIATADQSIKSYLNFINENPNSVHVTDAWTQIFVRETKQNTIKEYQNFIKKYPESPMVKDAWLKTYEIYTALSSPDTFFSFMFDYPNFPYREIVEKDILLNKKYLLKVIEDNKWGYIDNSGELLIPYIFDNASFFTNGYALVGTENKVGFINKKGKIVIPFLYDEAESFGKETAIVATEEKYGIIKRDGKIVLPLMFDEIFEFKQGYAVVKKDDLYGYINNRYQLVIDCRYEDASNFSDSLAKISENDYYGFINFKGELVIPASFAWADNFSGGITRVKNDNDLFGLIDKKGNFLLKPEYDFIGKFNEGAAIISKNNKFGYINNVGEIIVPIIYDYSIAMSQVAGFSNDLALVQKNSKVGFVNKLGKVEIPISYDGALTFSEFLAPVKVRDKWGVINNLNKMVIPPSFENLWGFKNNICIAKKDNQIGVINTLGETVVPFEFKEIISSDFPYLITIDIYNKKGLYLSNGTLVLENKFDNIEIIPNENIAIVHNSGKFAYFDIIKQDYIWEEYGFTEL
jgi:hypothetical protein